MKEIRHLETVEKKGDFGFKKQMQMYSQGDRHYSKSKKVTLAIENR